MGPGKSLVNPPVWGVRLGTTPCEVAMDVGSVEVCNLLFETAMTARTTDTPCGFDFKTPAGALNPNPADSLKVTYFSRPFTILVLLKTLSAPEAGAVTDEACVCTLDGAACAVNGEPITNTETAMIEAITLLVMLGLWCA
jgi:hypothetical protein